MGFNWINLAPKKASQKLERFDISILLTMNKLFLVVLVFSALVAATMSASIPEDEPMEFEGLRDDCLPCGKDIYEAFKLCTVSGATGAGIIACVYKAFNATKECIHCICPVMRYLAPNLPCS